MSIIIDILAVVFLAFFVYKGGKKGLVISVFKTFSFILSLFATAILYQPLVESTANSVFGVDLKERVASFISSPLTKTPDILLSDMSIPKALTNGISESEPVKNIVDILAGNITHGIITIFVIIALFILIKVIIKIAVNPIKLVSKLPLIKQINSFGGGLVGFIAGILWLYVIIACIGFLSFIPGIDEIAKLTNESYVISNIYNNNILLYLISSLLTSSNISEVLKEA